MRINKSLIAYTPASGAGSGSVTSVALSAPTGFTVSGSPITSSGTLSLAFASGYSLPTTIKQSNWDDAYTFVANFPSQTGNNGKFLYTSGSVLSWQPALQNPMSNYGEMIFGGTSGVPSIVSPNFTTTKKYLQQVGDGTTPFAPSWGTLDSNDITGAAISTSNDTNILITASGNTTNALLRTLTLTTGWTGQLAVGRGGTGAATLTGVVIGNGTNVMTGVVGTSGQFLRRNIANTAYEFRTLQGGDIAGSELTFTNDTNVTMSLSGTPASSLLQPVNIGLGWSGTLSVSRGGIGVGTITGVMIGNGTSAVTGVTGSAGQLLRRNLANTAYEFFTASLISGNGVADRLAKWTSDTNLIDSQIIDNGTNVGIGLATPDAKLRVSGIVNGVQAIFTNIDGRGLQISTSLEAGTNDAGSILNARGASSGTLIFQTDSVEKARITPSGNLGIGVSPSYKLHVAGTGYFASTLYAASAGAQLQIAGGALACGLYQGASSNILYIANWTTPTLGLQVDVSSGNVGIGINPSYKLDVNGNTNVLGTIFSGNVSSTNGSIMLQDNYSSGHLTNFGTSYSSGAPVIGFGVTPSTSTYGAFLSSTTLTAYPRSAVVVDSDIYFYTGASQTVAVGSSASMLEVMRITNAGTLQVKQGDLQLPTTKYITWGGAYGADIPTISGTSGSANGFLQFYPAGSTSGVKMALRRTGQLYLGSYTSSTSFTGTAVATLAVTNGGDVITIAPSQTTASGTYTPTWTGLANVGSVTAFSCQYMRVGDTVTVSGWVTIDAVADNTPTSLSFSLPINSNTTSVNYLNGTGVQQGGGAAASLSGYGANYGEFEVSPLVDTAINYSFHFTYRII